MQRKRKTRRSSSVSHGSLWFLHRCGLHACGHHTLMLPNPAPASAAAPPVRPSQAALFQLRRKKSYDYCVLPLGLFLSMRVYVQCSEAMLWWQGIHLVTYLDDRLLLAQSQQEVKVHTSVVMVPTRSGVCNKPGKITVFFCFCPKKLITMAPAWPARVAFISCCEPSRGLFHHSRICCHRWWGQSFISDCLLLWPWPPNGLNYRCWGFCRVWFSPYKALEHLLLGFYKTVSGVFADWCSCSWHIPAVLIGSDVGLSAGPNW